ncbi:uncharacterized protein CIMG_05378 [Coccidioides immitis RS]|uniref:Protein kinase domain-containing protein n=1 Tax=Coccidioides immitis (strain RS) TaxID=246410 RepID=J3KFF7_COCIM|nr:uncharacterized protein CIMG_05378 [Coccidioides immitis RS]EAS34354.3 hypothetical protein CIMG_05378 [Coccidioides immitis RS]
MSYEISTPSAFARHTFYCLNSLIVAFLHQHSFKFAIEFVDIDVSEIFKEWLAKRKFCVTFLVIIRGKTCVMKVHLPHPKIKFVKDEDSPTAILSDYILNIKELNWINYYEKRMQNFVDDLNTIYKALVQHSSVHSRNMMIVEEDLKRATWIDFNRAQTFSQELTER